MNAITNSDRFSELPKLIKERGDGAVLTILFDEAEERGIEKGRKIGERKGRKIGEREGRKIGEIEGTIRIYDSEMHLPPTEIVQKIMTRFPLRKEETEWYVEQTLKLTNR